MKKVLCIGECALDIVFGVAGEPLGAMPGGRIGNAAALLAREGLPVVMASEAAADAVGDNVVATLADAGVNTRCIDRFTEGRTPVTVFMPDADGHIAATRYESYGEDCFDIIWPDISEGDIVVFGGYYAIDRRMRRRMLPLLQHAADRKALMVYLPGYMPQQEPRITRVMPALLENLELAHMVCTRSRDLRLIFNSADADACWRNHISFYCPVLLHVDPASRSITFYSNAGNDTLQLPVSECASLVWNAGVAAGAVKALFDNDADTGLLSGAPAMLRQAVLRSAVAMADTSVAALPEIWQRSHE